MNNKIAISLTLVTLLLASCGVWPEKKPNAVNDQLSMLDSFDSNHHRLIADNLLSTMSQIDDLTPLTTTVQLSYAQTPFGRAVQESIIGAGYGTQDVEGDLGANLIRYLAENAETEQGFRTRYRIEIGDYYAEREYQIKQNSVIPTSEMRIGGYLGDELPVNDAIFNSDHFDSTLSYTTSLGSDEPQIKVIAFDRGAFNLDDSKGASSGVFSARSGNQPNASFSTSSVEPVTGKANMYITGDSNFQNVFKDYEDTLSGILVFPNDSLVLGNSNKSYIRSLARTFDPKTEIFSVIGCSHGNTSLDNGNEILANGRANRVKEALLLAGIDEKNIYDEGCWASEYYDEVMPRRGVLLTRKKLVDRS